MAAPELDIQMYEGPGESDISESSSESSSEPASESEEEYDGDINDDLYDALAQDFKFNGSYFHRSRHPGAPNPGLTVAGIGSIGLPLSERDAKLLISRAAQAPFGKGDQTVVDTSVRDTWEIEPASISFRNPNWFTFVDEMAVNTVAATLGVTNYATKPRCELYKMLLYQPGSHTSKADGMFATVIFVLPSAFEGGQVHLSHAGRTSIIDVSQNSEFNTSVLAWYTDVVHEVKPILSGYRLALSYNLIHTSPNTTPPSLPDIDPMEDLRTILELWQDYLHMTDMIPKPPFFAYVLDHQYSQKDLNSGVAGLKGRDAHLLGLLRPVADELRFSICLANVKKTEKGSASEETPRCYRKRGRYDDLRTYDGSDEKETAEMGEIEETTLEISNLVKIGENGPVKLGGSHDLNPEALVPRDAFEGLRPDDSSYEGYMGNVSLAQTHEAMTLMLLIEVVRERGTMSVLNCAFSAEFEGKVSNTTPCTGYNRSVLILFRQEDEASVIMKVCGEGALLRTLDMANPPTLAAERAVKALLSGYSNATAVTLLGYANAWKRRDIWNSAFPWIGVSKLDTINTELGRALAIFSLGSIMPGIVQLVKREESLQKRMALVESISSLMGQEGSAAWKAHLTRDVFLTYHAADVADIPLLISMSQEQGYQLFQTAVLPVLAKEKGTYSFHIALAKALQSQYRKLSDAETEMKAIYISIMHECLTAAISHWQTIDLPVGSRNWVFPKTLAPLATTERIKELVSFSFSIDAAELCIALFESSKANNQLDIIVAVESRSKGTALPWLKGLKKTALESYSTSAASDVPALVSTLQEMNTDTIEKFSTQVEKFTKGAGVYEFLVELAKALNKWREVESQTMDDKRKDAIEDVILQCVASAAPQWETDTSEAKRQVQPTQTKGHNERVKCIAELADLCLSIGKLQPCVTLISSIFAELADKTLQLAHRCKEVHIPLMPMLKTILEKHGKKITDKPFDVFLAQTISVYLAHVLGATRFVKPPAWPPTLPIGCECADCKKLNAWFETSTPTINFNAVKTKKRLTHLEACIDKGKTKKLLATETRGYGMPLTFIVRKLPDAMKSVPWKEAQAAATSFLKSVVDGEELKALMGERYADVLSALKGEKRFQLALPAATAPATSTPDAAALSGTIAAGSAITTADSAAYIAHPPSSSTSGPLITSTPPAAGVKRKEREPPKNTIAVIDLT
ncbi:hypothetical protein D9611_006618 [Ephemerocybe angulata]|uniref:Prolyl 4-hydroxylase alpha subunit Fe(2+) 2OG dioxygenase domain-containing protein n=1 Tax=Ephemerocybe angulata TaxID=980116 RepID=A0A8H5C7Z3_9AGAR|nr:hypothetical protein D9611_006618 [Tulosesus angulatus]